MDYDFNTLREMERAENLTPLKFHDREDKDGIMEARLGRITGSNFGKVVARTKDKKGYALSAGEVAKKLIYRAVWERLLISGTISDGLRRLDVNSPSVLHGEEYEAEAIQRYMEVTGNEVDYKQKFIEHDAYIGGTPDGYIGNEGLIEVKCPKDGSNILISLIEKEVYNKEHMYQMQGYLWMTGRKWCDYVVYDPHINPAFQLNIIRVERDEAIIAGIAGVMEQVKLKIDEIMNHEKLRQLKG